MKTLRLASLALLALATISAAQTVPASPSSAPGATTLQSSAADDKIPAGMVITAELSKSLDAKKAKPGDKIEARTAMDLLSHGTIVIPRDAKIIGHVTEAKANSKASPGASLGIAFDRVMVKGGRELQMQAVVQALGRPLQNPALAGGGLSNDNSGIAPASDASRERDIMGGMRLPSRSPAGSSAEDASSRDAAALGRTTTALGPTSQGVVGMKGLTLKSEGAASVVSSEKDNVRLDSGTQVILRTQ